MISSRERVWTPPRTGESDLAYVEFDPDTNRPDLVLLGWYNAHWELVTEFLLSHAECCNVFKKGLAPYTHFMVVFPSEFSFLGLPGDFEASAYFNMDNQRALSLRNHSGRRAETLKQVQAVTDRIIDPRGE